MRVAELCPGCPYYINADCVIYNGPDLNNIGLLNLESMEDLAVKVNQSIPPLTGTGAPSVIPKYIGQFYVDVTNSRLYVGLSTSAPTWGYVVINP